MSLLSEQNRLLNAPTREITTTVVVGNPKPGSRTALVARRLASRLGGDQPVVYDLVELGPKLLLPDDPEVAAAATVVASSDLVIWASPTYKATFTGLLKLFLEQFAGTTGLSGVVSVPVMLAASSSHALAAELHLKPVLVELGAIVATPALALLDDSEHASPAEDRWVAQWAPVIARLTQRGRQ